jgi:hypothetical protein
MRDESVQSGRAAKVFDFLECRVNANVVQLLMLQNFVNDSFPAFIHRYDFMNRSVAG